MSFEEERAARRAKLAEDNARFADLFSRVGRPDRGDLYPDFGGLFDGLFRAGKSSIRVVEEDGMLTFRVPVPGCAKEDLSVTTTGRHLAIKSKDGQVVEEFDAQFSLKGLRVSCKNGMLTFTVPVAKGSTEVEVE